MISLGRAKNASTVYLYDLLSLAWSSPPICHNRQLGYRFSDWHLVVANETTDPNTTDKLWSSLPLHCCLHIVLQLTMAEALLHCQAGCSLITAILLSYHNVGSLHSTQQFAHPHFPIITVRGGEIANKELQIVRNSRTTWAVGFSEGNTPSLWSVWIIKCTLYFTTSSALWCNILKPFQPLQPNFQLSKHIFAVM